MTDNNSKGLLVVSLFLERYPNCKNALSDSAFFRGFINPAELILYSLMTICKIRDHSFISDSKFNEIDEKVRIQIGTGNSRKSRLLFCNLILSMLLKSDSEFLTLCDDRMLEGLIEEAKSSVVTELTKDKGENIPNRSITINDKNYTPELVVNNELNLPMDEITRRIVENINGNINISDPRTAPSITRINRKGRLVNQNINNNSSTIISGSPVDQYNVDYSARRREAMNILNQTRNLNIDNLIEDDGTELIWHIESWFFLGNYN